MKKFMTIALAALTLAGCKQAAKSCDSDACAADDTQKTTLVAYFSASGVTRNAAQLLATELDADIFEIEPQELYTEDDLNWRDSTSRSSVEMKDASARPAIKALPAGLQNYETIYLGFPIWWGVAPRVINSFIEQGELKAQKIITFATSGGSELQPATDALQQSYPDIKFINGYLLNEATAESVKAAVELAE